MRCIRMDNMDAPILYQAKGGRQTGRRGYELFLISTLVLSAFRQPEIIEIWRLDIVAMDGTMHGSRRAIHVHVDRPDRTAAGRRKVVEYGPHSLSTN